MGFCAIHFLLSALVSSHVPSVNYYYYLNYYFEYVIFNSHQVSFNYNY